MAEIDYEHGKPGRSDGIKDRSNIYIDVQAYGGSDIGHVCHDMVALADRLGIAVWATLNGVRTLARPGDNPAALFREWDKACSSRTLYKIAST